MTGRRVFSSWGAGVRPSGRAVAKAVAFALLSLAIVELVVLVSIVEAPGGWSVAMDYQFYKDVGERWLRDGSYYRPHQLAGPYEVTLMTDVLYPPIALFLFVPLTIVPALVWWLIPVAVLTLAWWRWRPDPWTWPIVLGLLMWPRSMATFVYGNSDMWVAAGVAGGLLSGWPAAIVLLKPTLAPLVVVGVRHRSWWAIPIGLLVAFLLTAGLWFDYFTVVRNLRIGSDYSIGSLPLVCIPLVMWLGRRVPGRPDGRSTSMPGLARTFGAVTHRTGSIDSPNDQRGNAA